MSFENGSSAIEHKNADCHCTRCEQLRKPDKIIALPSRIFRQRVSPVNQNAADMIPDNVISMSAAMQSAEKLSVEKVRRARFNYPMLECT